MRTALVITTTLGLAACGSSSTETSDAPSSTQPDAAVAAPISLVDWVASSGWVFRGRVVELAASTEAQPPDWADPEHLWNLDHMIVFEGEQISLEPAALPLVPATRHTMILRGPASDFAVGQEVYFFARLFSAGQTLVMIENGRLDGALAFDHVHQAVHAAKRYIIDRSLYDRMIAADRVVLGRVTAIADIPGPITDEGPDWWEATLLPQRTLHGPIMVDPVTVRFDGGGNECCYTWPKLHPDDYAIYLLQPDGITGLPDARWVLWDPEDQQVSFEEDRLRSLLASPPVAPVM